MTKSKSNKKAGTMPGFKKLNWSLTRSGSLPVQEHCENGI